MTQSAGKKQSRKTRLTDLVEVRKSTIHGRGVFAKTIIKRGTKIGTYEGDVTTQDGTYVLWVPMDNGKYLGVDGKNLLRFMNHSSRPNITIDGIDVIAAKTIPPGSELVFHYGEDWDDVD